MVVWHKVCGRTLSVRDGACPTDAVFFSSSACCVRRRAPRRRPARATVCRCYDVTSRAPSPPQGLQLVLRAPSLSPNETAASAATAPAAVVADTVVMENLGYFQLQAAPGVWELALADGRASDVYEIVGEGGAGAGGGGDGGGAAAHAAPYEVGRRLQRELEGEASPPAESQAIAVRNFYSR